MTRKIVLQYALSRTHWVENLLKFPITSRPVYLAEKDSLNQKKTPKHDMTTILLKLLNKGLIHVSEIPGQVPHAKTTAVVINFIQCL